MRPLTCGSEDTDRIVQLPLVGQYLQPERHIPFSLILSTCADTTFTAVRAVSMAGPACANSLHEKWHRLSSNAHRGLGKKALQDVQPVGLDDGDLVCEAPKDERTQEEDEQLRVHSSVSCKTSNLSRQRRHSTLRCCSCRHSEAACPGENHMRWTHLKRPEVFGAKEQNEQHILQMTKRAQQPVWHICK